MRGYGLAGWRAHNHAHQAPDGMVGLRLKSREPARAPLSPWWAAQSRATARCPGLMVKSGVLAAVPPGVATGIGPVDARGRNGGADLVSEATLNWPTTVV